MMCNKQLSTGEELYILDEFKFVCKEDYHNNNGKDTILLSGDLRKFYCLSFFSITTTKTDGGNYFSIQIMNTRGL